MRIAIFTLSLGLMIQAHAEGFVFDQKPTFCPPPSAFSKDPRTLTWHGPKHWKSFNPSFADKLTQFSQAQWQGTNIGVILCTYKTDNDSAFPVFVQAPGNYQKPSLTGSHWVERKGVISCFDANRTHCGFHRAHEHKPNLNSNQDLIQFLDEVKQAPKPLTP